MPNLYQFSELEFLAFFLVLIRMSAFVVTWPIFGVPMVPSPLKILLGLVLALLIFPTSNWQEANLESSLQSMSMVMLFIKEAFIGLTIGYLGRLFFYAVSVAGEIVSISMGLSSAQMFNPALEGRSSIISQFLVGIATLFFLSIKGHHLFLTALNKSFEIIPMSQELISFGVFKNFGVVVQEIVTMGFQLSAPILVSILFMNLIMAVIGRAVPQINVLITSMPVNILVGFIVMIVALPLMMFQMSGYLETSAMHLFQILKEY